MDKTFFDFTDDELLKKLAKSVAESGVKEPDEKNTAGDFYTRVKEQVFGEDSPLDDKAAEELHRQLDALDEHILRCQKLKLMLGRLSDYDALKKRAFTAAQIRDFCREDSEYLEQVDGFYANNLEKRDYMFGYPSNMEEDTYLLKYLRFLESKIYLMNNCGDPYQTGNYGMDSKETERRIIAAVAKNLGLVDEDGYWGYITTGGTESNFWGIREGFNKFPAGKLYFSATTHYSVEKFVSNNKREVYPYEVVTSEADDSICVNDLKTRILGDLEGRRAGGAVLVLTWGTTLQGAVDPVSEIVGFLKEQGIPYYCHLDAALYGGIAADQLGAPFVRDLRGLNVDSVSISLHKFFGSARANGILLALHRDKRNVVEYIGQEDSTMLGSRDYLPFSTFQRVRELLDRRERTHYMENVTFFRALLAENKVPFTTFNETSDIFVIDKPSDALCKKYQLTTFTDAGGKEKAHIIIFPFHKKEIMRELAAELRGEL